jgi:hypothetical protein
VGIPGTGLSYRERLDDASSGGLGWVAWLVSVIVLLKVFFGR